MALNFSHKAIILLVATAGLVVFLGGRAFTESHIPNLEDMQPEPAFKAWKLQYSKTYNSTEEESRRFAIFQKSLALVRENNRDPSKTYKLKLNHLADLSPEEFRQKYLMKRPFQPLSEDAERNESVEMIDMMTDVPASINWVQKGAVTMVKTKGSILTSEYLGAVDALESASYINQKKITILSVAELADCVTAAYPEQIFAFTTANGIESDCIYPEMKGTCKASPDWVFYQPEGYKTVPTNDNDALKAAVAQQPVLVLIDALSPAFQLYSSGIMKDSDCTQHVTHAVLLVGYDQENGKDYWLIKNSWGTGWGEQGYARIERVSGQQPGACGISQRAIYPYGLKKKASSKYDGVCENKKSFLA